MTRTTQCACHALATILISAFLISGSSSQGTWQKESQAFSCYVCHSADTPECTDQFDVANSSMLAEECVIPDAPQDTPQLPSGQNRYDYIPKREAFTKCIKWEINGYTARACFATDINGPPLFQNELVRCEPSTGCRVCDTQLCNTASKHRGSLLAIILALFYYISC